MPSSTNSVPTGTASRVCGNSYAVAPPAPLPHEKPPLPPNRRSREAPAGARCLAHRGQAHLVVGSQPVIGLLALAVDPHFPAAQQPVDPAAGHAGQLAQQEIVEPLAGVCVARPHAPHADRLNSVGGHRSCLTY
jgi:hypothetical protein